jgi:hypothetical protein
MDALDRTFRHLVHTIQTRCPAYLTQPFEVADLYQTILPYRHHRRELGLESNQDYELALLQLLSGARDYLLVEDKMRDRLTRELASPNPDPGAFREFESEQVALSPEAVRRVQEGLPLELEPVMASPSPAGANESASTAQSAPQRQPAPSARSAAGKGGGGSPARGPAPRSPIAASPVPVSPAGSSHSTRTTPSSPGGGRASSGIIAQAGEQCKYCNGQLPAGRRITFCPHCGQNLTVVNCLACGTELDLGWKFCTTCGRPVSNQ